MEFWSWFSSEAERLLALAKSDGGAFIGEVGEVLARDAPGVICEVRPRDEDAVLVISADGKREHLDAVRAVVAAAPKVPSWEVVAFRQRADIGGVRIEMNGVALSAEEVSFLAFAGSDGHLGLELRVRGYTGAEDDPRALIGVILMDHTVGEYDSMTAIHSLRIEALAEDEEVEGLRPLTALPAFLDQVKDQGLDQWAVYMTSLDDAGNPASIMVKTGLGAWVPQAARPQRLRVLTPIQSPREDGLIGDPAEVDRLYDLEEQLCEAMEGAGALFVGRVTTCGLRDFVFYGPADALLDVPAQQALAAYPAYDADYESSEDAEWGFFHEVLLPSAFESLAQAVDNEVFAREQAGDDLTRPRRVRFVLAFPSEEALAACSERLAELSPLALPSDPEQELAYPLQVEREIPLVGGAIRPLVVELYEAFEPLQGAMLGWELSGESPQESE